MGYVPILSQLLQSVVRQANLGLSIVSIMDVIMFEAQRQGRLSFYMVCQSHIFIFDFPERYLLIYSGQVSAGEEGISVGSAAALTPDDVVFAQYRETGVFQQRGFTLKNFMSQLFANANDSGRGRNMPVHYGCQYPRTVRRNFPFDPQQLAIESILTAGNSTQSPQHSQPKSHTPQVPPMH